MPKPKNWTFMRHSLNRRFRHSKPRNYVRKEQAFEEKICACGNPFSPRSNNQLRCIKCRDDKYVHELCRHLEVLKKGFSHAETLTDVCEIMCVFPKPSRGLKSLAVLDDIYLTDAFKEEI